MPVSARSPREPQAAHEEGLLAHPEALTERDRSVVARVELRDDPMQSDRPEGQIEHGARSLGSVTVPGEVGMQRPADLSL